MVWLLNSFTEHKGKLSFLFGVFIKVSQKTKAGQFYVFCVYYFCIFGDTKSADSSVVCVQLRISLKSSGCDICVYYKLSSKLIEVTFLVNAFIQLFIENKADMTVLLWCF